jgi:phosphatidylinositol-3-phosphatase
MAALLPVTNRRPSTEEGTQGLSWILQPPCVEGASSSACTPGTPGGLAGADAFLRQTVPQITATAAYRAHGLIVVVFEAESSSSDPALGGPTTTLLGTRSPTGVLLVSPFARPGARASISFNPAFPKKSLQRLLKR